MAKPAVPLSNTPENHESGSSHLALLRMLSAIQSGENLIPDKTPSLDEDFLLLSIYSYAASFFTSEQKKLKGHLLTMFDEEVDEIGEGNSFTLYDSQFCTVVVKKRTSVKRVDSTKLLTALRKLGVSKEVIDKAKEAASVVNRPAVVVEVNRKV